jgi:hypothetical protein
MTMLNFGRDIQGFNAYAPVQSALKYSAELTSLNNDSITVPGTSQQWIAAFSYQPGTNVWVSVNDTAEVPAGATFAVTTSELNPAPRLVQAGDVIDFITDNATAEVGVMLYEFPQF